MEPVNVIVNGNKKTAAIGTRLSELNAGNSLPCGGHGKCGKCKVIATGALSEISAAEAEKLTEEELRAGIRLACCAEVLGECRVEAIPLQGDYQVLSDGLSQKGPLEPSFEKYGVAIDIGTTTLAAAFMSADGKKLAECGGKNPQAAFGADVISRIESAMSGNAEDLSETLLSAIDSMIIELSQKAGIPAADIDGIVMTGNTAMLYLLTGTSPEPLSHAPFHLSRGFGEEITAFELGLKGVPGDTKIYLPPCISAFIGADTVCALLSSDMCSAEKNAMLADIGTNGEMALWKEGRLSVCSTAAGPAFEGVGIKMGMCGSKGAIDQVALKDGKLVAHVIENAAPAGICGSGLVDAVAALLENETLDETGFLEEDETVIAYPVVLTKRDIRMVQLAKSAVCAGIQTLLHEAGTGEDQVDVFYLAGGFGNYLNKHNAGRIGLLPKGLIEKVAPIGNAALGGAAMLLLNRSLRKKAEEISKNADLINLSTSRFFSDAYMLGMTFPDDSDE